MSASSRDSVFFLATCGTAAVLATVASLAAVSFLGPEEAGRDDDIATANASRDREELRHDYGPGFDQNRPWIGRDPIL